MEDRLEVTDEGLDSDIIGYPAQEPAASSSRKPSILRKQMLRRTTTRTRKRPPESVGTTPTDGDHSVATIQDASSSAPDIVQPITIPQISSLESEDGILSLQLLSELELKKGAQIDRNNATKDGDDVNSSLDISIIESDDEASGVEVSLIEEESLLGEEESKALIEEASLLGEEESKAEVEVDDEVDIVPVEQIPEEKRTQTKTMHTSAVATSNLSIVLSGNDIVVEYRDDKIKESLPPKAPSSSRQTLTPNRPKGIMKRPRHSKIKYHHPRRPLPPPLPPPGYKEVSTSPKSCVTATSIDSGYSSSSGNHQPMKKRVSFNERELVEQHQMSRLRRKEKYDKRRSFLGILSMAMPVVMPYLMAVLILVASSMVPLPTDQNYQQQKEHALSMHQEFESNLPRPVQSPFFLDVGSRMWEERRRAKEEASAI